ncbi:hypothetical protein BDD12DRAFT_801760 [Trichophaea hybrida]|nr:hypothetical protein BDD12DRAFT_801760 [Trichophaea hybrida]
MEATIRTFFRSPYYAVVGASTDPSKFGHKVPTIPSIRALPKPQETSVSIITPPGITLSVLKDAADVGVKRVWMQPGAWDDECVRVAKERGLEAVVYGAQEELGYEGACVLVHGEKGMKGAASDARERL